MIRRRRIIINCSVNDCIKIFERIYENKTLDINELGKDRSRFRESLDTLVIPQLLNQSFDQPFDDKTICNDDNSNIKDDSQKRVIDWPYYDDDEIQSVVSTLKSGKINYWTGTKNKEFETKFANYIGVDYAITLANGTLALELALRCLDIGPNDEVIIPSKTYVATATTVLNVNANVIFSDVDMVTQNITVEEIEKVRTDKTKAIICVHLGGMPCNMLILVEYCKQNNIYLIEDCAQAHGAKYCN